MISLACFWWVVDLEAYWLMIREMCWLRRVANSAGSEERESR